MFGRSSSASVVDVLSDEVLQQLCTCLPGRELLRFAVANSSLHSLTLDSHKIWHALCYALLGEPLCRLHVTLANRAEEAISTEFWRKLFRRGLELRLARWSPDLRGAFLASGEGGDGTDEAKNEAIKQATVGSGHCAVGIGSRVVKLGGLRPQCQLDHVHAAIFDLNALTVREVNLTADSEKPERRMRHAACAIKPAFLGGKDAVLALGGCSDHTKQPCEGGLKFLHILELLDDTSNLGRWHSVWAEGQAPSAIWHHICGSFAGGKRVVVFGGDFKRDDPEFTYIQDRSLPSGVVYVLDVDLRCWERVATTGLGPTWRSLHAGLTHLDVSSHSERLVVLGGCAAHIPIFGSSDILEPMRGHALDLNSFEWLPQPRGAEEQLPPARLRLASEKLGEWLLLYGGHGDGDAIGERVRLHKLNLRTLAWGTLEVRGREGSYSAAPAATLTSGLVLGGVRFTPFGISTVPKLDVLTLCDGDEPAAAADEETQQTSETSHDSDEESGEGSISVLMRDAQGNTRRTVMPRAMLAMLLAMQDRNERD